MHFDCTLLLHSTVYGDVSCLEFGPPSEYGPASVAPVLNNVRVISTSSQITDFPTLQLQITK